MKQSILLLINYLAVVLNISNAEVKLQEETTENLYKVDGDNRIIKNNSNPEQPESYLTKMAVLELNFINASGKVKFFSGGVKVAEVNVAESNSNVYFPAALICDTIDSSELSGPESTVVFHNIL